MFRPVCYILNFLNLFDLSEHTATLSQFVFQEKARERALRDEMERELREKDQQLQEMLKKHSEMETRLQELNTVETETKLENERLEKVSYSIQLARVINTNCYIGKGAVVVQ